ncbi:phosphoglycerate kinase [Rickettsiales bacterium]|nr:phosphoglycerate kinase [Rickettsiales bacterium]
MKYSKLIDCVVTNKNVIVRADLNVPITKNIVTDNTRLKAVIPTLKYLVKNNAKVILISHFGRPKGVNNKDLSLKNIITPLQELLGDIKLNFIDDIIGNNAMEAVSNCNYGEIILLENLRFYAQEENNSAEFAQKISQLGNIYVNDAFACSHRSHASIVGIPNYLKSCAGLLMQKELENLDQLLYNAKKPMIAIIGGAKISTKIKLINNLSSKVDAILIGGAMANSFYFAQGYNIGKSLCEKDFKQTAIDALENAKKNNCKIILPQYVITTKSLAPNAQYQNVTLDQIQDDDIIADIGINSLDLLNQELRNYSTLLWNGPVGAFEIKPFDSGTNKIAQIIANLTKNNNLISVAGGGDSVSAINKANLSDSFSYISTAGGAFLEWLENYRLPGIDILLK